MVPEDSTVPTLTPSADHPLGVSTGGNLNRNLHKDVDSRVVGDASFLQTVISPHGTPRNCTRRCDCMQRGPEANAQSASTVVQRAESSELSFQDHDIPQHGYRRHTPIYGKNNASVGVVDDDDKDICLGPVH